MADADAPVVDPEALLRSKQYRVLLVFAAVIGVVVSLAAWCFLAAVHTLQVGVYEDLPDQFGYDTAPWWWPLPWLALGGALTAFAIIRLPGHGGHVPVDGLKSDGPPTRPVDLPGVLLAAVATLSFGLVLGPEGPLIALGMGLGTLAVHLVRKDAAQQMVAVMAAAGSFAAIATVFGSPVIGAVILIEAAGLGGSTLPVVLLPGLIASGIGSLVFIGMGAWSGLSTSAWSLSPLVLPPYAGPGWGDFGWTIVLALAVAVVGLVIFELAHWAKRVVAIRPFVLTIAAALVVGVLAVAFQQLTDQSADAVLFSGQEAFPAFMQDAPGLSLPTLALLLVFKGVAWSISLGNFRGGPTFPSLFLGAAAGIMAGHLPGFSETPAVAALMGAACVATLKLPLSSIVIALLLTTQAGLAVAPLVIVAVTVTYIATAVLSDWRASLSKPAPAGEGVAGTAGSTATPA